MIEIAGIATSSRPIMHSGKAGIGQGLQVAEHPCFSSTTCMYITIIISIHLFVGTCSACYGQYTLNYPDPHYTHFRLDSLLIMGWKEACKFLHSPKTSIPSKIRHWGEVWHHRPCIWISKQQVTREKLARTADTLPENCMREKRKGMKTAKNDMLDHAMYVVMQERAHY